MSQLVSQICKPIKLNQYKPETKKNSVDKLNANKIYVKYVDPSKNHLFLESSNLITIDHLKAVGVSVKNMFVPNGDTATYEVIQKVIPNAVNMMSTEYLILCKKKFQTIWLDYCGTMEGNKNFRPINDFSIIVEKKLLEDGGIIGFTFCVRQKDKHYTKRTPRHKLSTKEIRKKHKIFMFCGDDLIDRKIYRWENACVDFCEKIQAKNIDNVKLDIIEYYRYSHWTKTARTMMYTFFVKINYL
jgi:hypothetical protein